MHQVLDMTLGFVELRRVSNATIGVAVAGMFRRNTNNMCGNAQVLSINCFYIARRSFLSGSQEGDGFENILETVTEHMQLYIIIGSSKINSGNFDVFKLR